MTITNNFGLPGLSIPVCRSLYRDFMRGTGFITSLRQHFAHDDSVIGTASHGMEPEHAVASSSSQATIAWSLPTLDFLTAKNQAYQEALLNVALPGDRHRIRAYLSKVHLGIAVITGVSCPW